MKTEQDMIDIGMASKSIPSLPDYRLVNVEHLAGAAPEATALPALFHIDFSQVPDLFQSKIGACTNHAYAEILIKRNLRLKGAVKKISPRFGYTLCKIEDGLATTDPDNQGTYCNMPFKIGVKYGFCTEDIIPNNTELSFNEYIYNRDIKNIPTEAFTQAAENKIPGYAQVGSYNNISEAQLKQGLMVSLDGVSICLPVGSEWWTSASGVVSWDSKDILPIRKMVAYESGHDVTMTGWETEAGTGRCKVYFRNHWSKDWGDQDNGWFYLDQHTLSEAWIVTEIPDALLAILKSLPAQKDFKHTWAADLDVGSTGADVSALQIALKIVGTFPFNQPITEYFGPITQSAMIAFQKEYKVTTPDAIASANGRFGPLSRAALNKLIAVK